MDNTSRTMKNMCKLLLYTFPILVAGFFISSNRAKPSLNPRVVRNVHDLMEVFPTSEKDIIKRTDSALDLTRKALDTIIALPDSKRTFKNTFKAYDEASNHLEIESSLIAALLQLSEDKAIRDICKTQLDRFIEFQIGAITQNESLYKALEGYELGARKYELLDEESSDYIKEVLKAYKQSGMGLPEGIRKQAQALRKKISKLKVSFGLNINEDAKKHICVTESQLAGMPEDFIKGLERTPEGLCKVGIGSSTSVPVFQNCTVEATRKALWAAYATHAWPVNDKVLEDLREAQEKLSHLFGYKTTAHYELEDEMAQSPEVVEKFLDRLDIKTREKMDELLKIYKANLPKGIALTEQGIFKPWDWTLIKNTYRKKHYNIDHQKIAEYFPADYTLKVLLELYESFFGIQLKRLDYSMPWNKDTIVLEASEGDGTFLGYIILDLFPREGKYSHAAHLPVIHPLKQNDGKTSPSVGIVMANFPKPQADRPSLLTHDNVTTFFHEFGHALHTLFSNTRMAKFAGTKDKIDFVEMPSQMLEEWMWEKDMIKRISKHYKTGESLPDEIIDSMIALKEIDDIDFVRRQLVFAQTSLQLFKRSASQSAHSIMLSMQQKYCPHKQTSQDEHLESAFLHLGVYGSRYYGYAWAQEYARDLFKYIKEQGIDNVETGKRYRNTILSKGGSKHPTLLLRDFLQREPLSNASAD